MSETTNLLFYVITILPYLILNGFVSFSIDPHRVDIPRDEKNLETT